MEKNPDAQQFTAVTAGTEATGPQDTQSSGPQPAEWRVRVLSVAPVTHDVLCIRLEKPPGYSFIPGQATEVSIEKPGWAQEKRPFTFTSLDDAPYLEFVIKTYEEHKGMTRELKVLKPGDHLLIGEAWGAIEYKGPGCFIAGGAGITPFIAIFRDLGRKNALQDNLLLFSNKTERDIILQEELSALLKERARFVITDEPASRYESGFIDEAYLRKNMPGTDRHFYVCGPPPMVESITAILLKLGASADAVVFEK